MAVVINQREQRRQARDWLAGRCTCTTCYRSALAVDPVAVAERLAEQGQQVPEQVQQAIDARRQQVVEQAAEWRPPWATIGVDLGKRTDHSAVALLTPVRPGEPGRWRVPSVTRLPLASGEGTSHYLSQARRIGAAVDRVLQVVAGSVTVLVDSTGVGEAVVELVAGHLPESRRLRLVQVVLTGGRSANHRGSRWSVSKLALIDPLTAALEQQEIRFGNFPHREATQRELLAYRVKPSSVAGGAERLEAEKDSDHDDLVIAVALATYAARLERPTAVRRPEQGRNVTGESGIAALYRRRLG